MKKIDHLSQRSVTYLLLISLFLQSCNHTAYNLTVPKEASSRNRSMAEETDVNNKQTSIEVPKPTIQETVQVINPTEEQFILTQKSLHQVVDTSSTKSDNQRINIKIDLGAFAGVPEEVLNVLFSYVGSKAMRNVRKLNRAFYKFSTGYEKPGLLGIEDKPQFEIPADLRAINKGTVDFGNIKGLTPSNMPSFPWFYLVGVAKNLPQEFWPHLLNSQINTLYLRCNKISDAELQKLAKFLPSSQICTLDLGWNQIGDQGSQALAKALPSSRIHTLHLEHNRIGHEGAQELAKALPGSQVRMLYLNANQIEDTGAQALARVLPDSQVRILYLNNNCIGDAGAQELAKYIPGSKVHILYLARNQIGNSGTRALLEALAGSKTHTFYLNDDYLASSGSQDLVPNFSVFPGVYRSFQ